MQYRDLTIQSLGREQLVIACDTSAAIGHKVNDTLDVDPKLTSAMCVRVPLLELLSIGAEPFVIVNLFGNEMKPTGEQLLKGIRSELVKAGYPDLEMNGSTEENMETTTTSLGVTLIGKALEDDLLWKRVKPRDVVYQIGYPYVGPDLLQHREEIVSYDDVRWIQSMGELVSEIVPVGSKGSWNEAEQVAKMNELSFIPSDDSELESLCTQSAGPSTTVLVVGKVELLQSLNDRFKHVFVIGEMGGKAHG